ncbi:MAG: hypothetical protein Q7R95_04800 [bacterium]|nr:hypothetical protein [bacterium]
MKTKHYILILIFISIITRYKWFLPQTIFTFGDWYYWPLESLKQLNYSWGTWINFHNLGNVNIQLPFNLFMFIWSILGKIGFGYEISSKLTFFIPIAFLSYLSPFILIKKLTKNNFISFISSIFYATTIVIIVNQLPFQFINVFAPLIIYLFIIALEENNIQNWIYFIILFCFGIGYEIRIMFIVSWILIFYFIFFYLKNIKKYLLNIILVSILFLFLNFYWLIPVLMNNELLNINAITNREIFGSWLFDLTHAFTIFNWLWTGNKPNVFFVKQPIIWFFWIIPILAFTVFLFKITNNLKKNIVFFSLLSLFGIFLTKQSASPFPNTYKFLYDNIPGFNLFREASKFFLITLIGYLGLLAYCLLLMYRSKNIIVSKYIFIFISSIIVIIALINIKPLLTNKLGELYEPRYIYTDYQILNNFIKYQNNDFRLFWTPIYSRWGYFSNVNSSISNIDIIQNEWKLFSSSKYQQNNFIINEYIMNIFKIKNAHQLFNLSSIKYVVIPIRDIINNDDFFIHYGNNRNYFINEINKINWLKKINIGTNDLVLYENEGYRPHLYLTEQKETIYKETTYKKIAFQFKNPTEYTISLNSFSQPFYLNFSEAFHSNWKLRVGEFKWFQIFTDKNYFIADKYHFKNDAQLNSYYIDLVSICKIYACKKNSDGTFNINLTLYFRPQSYFYLGVIISALTLISCLLYLTFIGICTLRKTKSD